MCSLAVPVAFPRYTALLTSTSVGWSLAIKMHKHSSSKRSHHHLKYLVERIVGDECRLPARGLLMLGAAAGGWAIGRWKPLPPTSLETHHGGLTLEAIQSLSSLVTTRVSVADVVTTRLRGLTGGAQVALVVKGDFLLEVDLAKARFESVDGVHRQAVLVLPRPLVRSPRLDHRRTRLFGLNDYGLWTFVPGEEKRVELLNAAYSEAQQLVASAARDPALIQRTRMNAERVLGTFFAALGWQVRIRWTG